ncbi:MAG: sugar phosphate isomerase/epimerase family protein [Cellulophaga sp.]
MRSRKQIKRGSIVAIMATFLFIVGCNEANKNVEENTNSNEIETKTSEPFFKLSLAQWSMHKMVWEEGLDPYRFAEKAKGWGFSGLEYVSGLYYKELEKDNFSKEAMAAFVAKSNAESEKYGMKNLLIMIDGQGDLATEDDAKRKAAVENHFKWVDAAAAMGCHAIRVNLAGGKTVDQWTASSIDGLTQLATYAKEKNINIIVENHGGFSSDAKLLSGVMSKVNMDNCGTLPDFGNFCIEKSDPSEDIFTCANRYDTYKGMEELMVHAKAVSAKSYDFDLNGKETNLDYKRILQIVKNAGYTGYIGVEYEGSNLGEEAGIIVTRNLLVAASKNLK